MSLEEAKLMALVRLASVISAYSLNVEYCLKLEKENKLKGLI